MDIRKRLYEMQDMQYRDFQARLMPTVAKECIIGVRMPLLRQLARELSCSQEARSFMLELPHKYYEENNLHGILISLMKDYNEIIEALRQYLPFVDNWAGCDLISPKLFKRHLPELYDRIVEWTSSSHCYTVRFGIEMLMSFYLDAAFKPEYLELVSCVRSEEYYVKMAVAWFFATALAKQYDAAILYIESKRMDPWTHNKTIQKALESLRVDNAQKEYLRTLKLK